MAIILIVLGILVVINAICPCLTGSSCPKEKLEHNEKEFAAFTVSSSLCHYAVTITSSDTGVLPNQFTQNLMLTHIRIYGFVYCASFPQHR